MVVQPQKGTFCIPEYKKHSLKIWCESLHNHYLLAFTEKLENRRKSDIFFFYSETNINFEKVRVAHPNEFSIRIWKKRFLGSKINFDFFFLNIKKFFCKTILLAVRRQSVKNAP